VVRDLEALLKQAEISVGAASDLVRARALGNVRPKDDRDFVSDVDLAVERDVRASLALQAPEIGFLGEEEGWTSDDGNGTYWVLDPVDGTTNLVKYLPLCAISLALVEDGDTVLGVVDLPFLGWRYTAIAGRGAYRDGRRLQASSTDKLPDAVVALGDYAVGADATRKNRERLAITSALAASVQRIRMFGSAAIDLAWVAEGRLDACVILSNNPWDTAAGALLAREAGALVVDASGAPHTLASTATIAAAAPLTETLVALLNRGGR
jgi:myo-inositol-1(or 4)-monophosphatase